MRRVCLTLPTNRACTATIAAVAEEAAYGAREFDVEVHLLILDSSAPADLAAHRAAVAALPPAPGVVVHHLDEDRQRAFLREVVAAAGLAGPDRLLDLMLPAGVSYGACTNRAFLLAEALGCASVHRRDSDSRYQLLDGEPVFPIRHELAALGRRAADVAGTVTRSRLDPRLADRTVALAGASFIGEPSVDLAELRALDPEAYREVVGLSVPSGHPELWRRHLVDEAFRGAGTTPFITDLTTLTLVGPTRVDMCNVALGREVYGRVPLPPATDTIGTDYFLLHLVHAAGLPGVLHNRHIVNYYTGERRSDEGFLAYQLRFAKYLLAAAHLEAVYAGLAAIGDGLLDERGRVRPAAVAALARESALIDPAGNAARLDVLDRRYRSLGGRYATAAGRFAERRARFLAEARADMADFALLVGAWAALTAHAKGTAVNHLPTPGSPPAPAVTP
ncbi:hypothetical protein HHL19_19310 [Streptomyces sp. R302]|uniref:DUF6271 family protein n=1 Tax=unclassified Streptomyces TaxID=2593676 RepID=UPI00145DA92D|nr:hypothetical protein [Streptomyces sp. R301]NML80759.1 hypothetical protein [Streptomyces sp. R302]